MDEIRTKHMDTDSEGKKRTSDSMEANMLIYQIDALRKNIYTLRQYQKTAEHKSLCDMIKEGGNKFWNFLLSKGEPTHDNVRDFQYRDINAFRNSNPQLFAQWQTAMEDEMKSLKERDIWDLVDCPPKRTPIKCRWVYDIKLDGRKKA